jgi:predicted nuclease of predicted toxin-antitoxin system
MMQFIADENLPLTSIRMVRAAGYVVFAVIEETPSALDHDILMRAGQEHLVIWTLDRDFGDLIYRQGVAKPAGVIYQRFQKTPRAHEPADMLLRLLAESHFSVEGFFTVVDHNGTRQRPLP